MSHGEISFAVIETQRGEAACFGILQDCKCGLAVSRATSVNKTLSPVTTLSGDLRMYHLHQQRLAND